MAILRYADQMTGCLCTMYLVNTPEWHVLTGKYNGNNYLSIWGHWFIKIIHTIVFGCCWGGINLILKMSHE